MAEYNIQMNRYVLASDSYDQLFPKTKTIDVVDQNGDNLDTLLPKGASGTLTVAGWVQQANDSFAQIVTIANVGLTSASNVIVDCSLSMVDLDADVAVLRGWGNVNNAVAGTNQLTFYCYAVKPDVNIPVNVVVSG